MVGYVIVIAKKFDEMGLPNYVQIIIAFVFCILFGSAMVLIIGEIVNFISRLFFGNRSKDVPTQQNKKKTEKNEKKNNWIKKTNKIFYLKVFFF